MNPKNLVFQAAISALALAGATVANNALAAGAQEQCAGVIKAGKNDCATSMNDCHSHVTVDASPEAWIYLPKGTCERIVGARVVTVKVPPPKK